MVGKMKELLNWRRDTPQRPEKEGNIRKKRVTWKLDDNSNTRKKKRKERALKKLAKVKPDTVSELVKRMKLINESLNELYVDDFRGDIDVLGLWLDARVRVEKGRAGTHSLEVGSRLVQDGGRALFPVPQGLKSRSVEGGE